MNSSRLDTLKSSKFFFAVLLLLSLRLQAQDQDSLIETFGPSGTLRASYWNRDKSLSDTRDFAVGSAWLNLRPKEVWGTKFYFDGYLQGSNLSRNNLSYGDLREGFLEKSFENLDLKIGRQIIVWGRADKFNPTDSFSTKDLTFLTTDDEEQRRGQFATQVKYNFEKFRLIGVWQSEWRESIFPVTSQAGVSFQNISPNNAANQFGLKMDSTGDDIDWSASYFDGFNRTPDFKVLSVSQGILLGLEYGRIQVYGFDFAKNVGDYGLRGEVAYTNTQDSDGNNPLQQNSNLQAVFGADRTIFENFNLNAQVIYKNTTGFVDPGNISDTNTRGLAQRLAIVSNQKYKDQFGISIRPGYKMLNETLELEVAFISWQRNGDNLTRPKITYALNDKMKAILGGEFYNGPSDTVFGQLKEASSIFAEIRAYF